MQAAQLDAAPSPQNTVPHVVAAGLCASYCTQDPKLRTTCWSDTELVAPGEQADVSLVERRGAHVSEGVLDDGVLFDDWCFVGGGDLLTTAKDPLQ